MFYLICAVNDSLERVAKIILKIPQVLSHIFNPYFELSARLKVIVELQQQINGAVAIIGH